MSARKTSFDPSEEPDQKRPRVTTSPSTEEPGPVSAPPAAAAVGGGAPPPPRVMERAEMPTTFNEMLGHFSDPDEAQDLEDLARHNGSNNSNGGGAPNLTYVDFDQLPAGRQAALLDAVRVLAAKAPAARSPGQLEHLRVRAARIKGFRDTARKSEMTAAYRRLVGSGEVAPTTAMEELLTRKKGRSHSGVLVVTTFFGPGEFSCPKDCHYCPNQPGIARSYLLKEPGVLRGFRNGWDPIRQFRDRASALDKNGHVVDKIELIILGGTFSFYPNRYAEEFIAASFYAANTYYDVRDETGGSSGGGDAVADSDGVVRLRPMLSLEEEITLNETARCRIIGVTVETRPDYITTRELRRFRALGVTRVQLGIQHLDDDILNVINRDCPTIKTVGAIKLLLDGGFKVDAHWMPDLPGSSYEKDREMFELLFSPENESFQVDQWKVYPTATVPFTAISEWHKDGRYKPYAELEGGALMAKLLVYIMSNCPYRIRLNRVVRDIPTTYIMGGERRPNLRQVIEKEMAAASIRCKDIRERECKGQPVDRAATRLFTDEFRASDGTELYMSVENADRTQLYGHLRLRLRDNAADPDRNILLVLTGCALIRELHTYGKLVAVHGPNTGGETQHIGVGTQLMREAERVARERGFERAAVIAGVGVRRYYAKLGYRLEETYMVKCLAAPSAAEAGVGGGEITEEQVLADDDNENADAPAFGGSIFAAVKGFFGLGGKSTK